MVTSRTLILGLACLLTWTAPLAQNKILIEHGYLHAGNGNTIETASIGIENGKIIHIKNSLTFDVDKSKYDLVIDATGQHIYPGFFAPNSTLGLTEIDAVRATVDFYEVGEFNPHVRALIAFNVESKVVATVRTNGVLFAQATPRGGAITGSSSLMRLFGWNWEDAVVNRDEGIHMNWPNVIRYGWREVSVNKAYKEEIAQLEVFFMEAKNYALSKEKNKKIDLRFEAMKRIFTGNQRVYFRADNAQEILDVIQFVRKFEIKHPVLVGGYDSYLILDQLRDSKIPVMLGRVHELPRTDEDDIHLPYKLPAILQSAGILFCLQNEGDMEAMNARNLPFLAGTARAYGLTTEQAVAAISLNPAKIMGVEKDYGSIDVGKSATLFISKGDALDMRTNQVTTIIMDGKVQSTRNHQDDLYDKYRNK
jgi:imidazolonepropionase-like amidohydrolase